MLHYDIIQLVINYKLQKTYKWKITAKYYSDIFFWLLYKSCNHEQNIYVF